ncbi:DNA-directed DNA polymerase II small subunit [Natrarchaeobaculum sulfurireducens]|uniref:DNA polymerase II small subunit n=1 Tax=Natrarchaeobaculum sulfurireducens TaxID=2044521 RepID=A0A346PA13_9EURY|nr:DNA-directed DNA polymerase II small subunit [Natrarchaeobaculum sulfurireducens]AXR76358.1 Archaeal DNA polymerase II, small subunit/DNA polymerase delta, subunit B [Natrarchaeobaculum sulfurireducens]
MPLEVTARIVSELTSRGYNVEREAVTKLAAVANPDAALERVVEDLPEDTLVVRTEHVDAILSNGDAHTTGAAQRNDDQPGVDSDGAGAMRSVGATDGDSTPSGSTANTPSTVGGSADQSPGETKGSKPGSGRSTDPDLRSLEIANDMTGESTGTGEYEDFVAVFRDRLERLGSKLRGRVNHRPATAIQDMPGGEEVAMVGLVNDVRSTASGHWLVELEDATGTFPWLVMKDREYADLVEELLCDEVLAMEGTLSGDSGIAFVDSMFFPDVPRTHEPSTADRHVQAALISDVHVGSQEFMHDAWNRFTDWLHTPEAQHVEYLLIAGDMVEGVGVYPNQDEELDVVDIYEQYEVFNEYLKQVPGNIEMVMIPGNHDAVRLAEPQPGFDDDLREIMSAHDARIVSNPSMVTLEGVSVLMYHGVSLDEVIAELPEEKASYDEPHKAMYQLLKKRHVAPQFGGHTRLAPEEKDYLIIDEVPDIFHTGHVHKLGFGKYHNVLAMNSGCWQAQTDFQKSVNINPDSGYAPIVDLDTLDVTVQKFS